MPLWSILYVGVVCTQSIVFIYIHEPNPSTSTFCTEINLIQFQISIHTLVLYLMKFYYFFFFFLFASIHASFASLSFVILANCLLLIIFLIRCNISNSHTFNGFTLLKLYV